MNTTTRFVVAAAVAVAAAVLGYTYLVAPDVGGPDRSGDPTPDPTPTPDAAALIQGAGVLEPGRYVITQVPPLRITITVPEGWESLLVPAMVWSSTQDKASVGFGTATDLFADPCDPGAGLVGIGPTVDDLVAGLADVPGLSVEPQGDVTISGYFGTHLVISGSDPGCDQGVEALLLESGSVDRPYPAGGDGTNWYIVDVDGRRLFVHAEVPRSNPANVAADVASILDSIVIEAP